MTDPGRERPASNGEHRKNRPDGADGEGRGPEPGIGARNMAAAYQGAIEAVLAVVLSMLFGYWLDGRLGTSPAFLLSGLVLGFAAFCVRLWRLRDLMAGPPGKGPKPPESS